MELEAYATLNLFNRNRHILFKLDSDICHFFNGIFFSYIYQIYMLRIVC